MRARPSVLLQAHHFFRASGCSAAAVGTLAGTAMAVELAAAAAAAAAATPPSPPPDEAEIESFHPAAPPRGASVTFQRRPVSAAVPAAAETPAAAADVERPAGTAAAVGEDEEEDEEEAEADAELDAAVACRGGGLLPQQRMFLQERHEQVHAGPLRTR